MFTIGQFSRITGFTIKAIRLYHDEGLIIPARVDPATGYRSFDSRNIEQARMIRHLQDLAFPLAEIRSILERSRDDADLLGVLERQKAAIEERARKLNLIVKQPISSLSTDIARQNHTSTSEFFGRGISPRSSPDFPSGFYPIACIRAGGGES